MSELKKKLQELAHDAGFEAIGFSRAETSAQNKVDLLEFTQRGFHGTMEWMETTRERRADPKVLWPEAKSVIVLGMNYGPAYDPMDLLKKTGHGAISCYAQNRDYHDTVKKRLKRMARSMVAQWDCEVKVFVDTAPVMEKPLAAQTQLGWQGKHTCIVSRDYGSWLFLGEIYTTLNLESDPPHQNHCGQCSRCLDICPTGAFDGAGKIDARKCISYLSIEYDGVIGPELAEKMGNRIYGCDDCLAVCPWTKFTKPTSHQDYHPRLEFRAPILGDLLELDDSAFRDFFRASPIKRIKRHRFIRNVLIAAANGKCVDLRDKIQRLRDDDHPVIAQTAEWVLQKLDIEAQGGN